MARIIGKFGGLSKARGVPVKTAAAARQNRRLAQKGWRVGHVAAEIDRRYFEPSGNATE